MARRLSTCSPPSTSSLCFPCHSLGFTGLKLGPQPERRALSLLTRHILLRDHHLSVLACSLKWGVNKEGSAPKLTLHVLFNLAFRKASFRKIQFTQPPQYQPALTLLPSFLGPLFWQLLLDPSSLAARKVSCGLSDDILFLLSKGSCDSYEVNTSTCYCCLHLVTSYTTSDVSLISLENIQ